jgi:2-polyprenyl-6-methoxyphenol hydroxylase-like FAD-dependent oxidoreductase
LQSFILEGRSFLMTKLSVGIIGGGIGGITAAVALRHFGIDAIVYERAEILRELGAGMMLWANASRVLDELGLLDKIIAVSGRTDNFLVRKSGGEILMKIATGDFEVPSVCIPRAELLSILVDALPVKNIKLGYEFEHLEQSQNKAHVHFANDAIAEHDILIGADGLRSKVRDEVFGTREPIYRGYLVWRGIGHYEGNDLPANSSSETWGKGKRFGILNTGNQSFTWYAAANVPSDHRDSEKGRKTELLEMFADWHSPIAELISSTPENLIMKNAACDHHSLKKWVKGRVVLLGDSAHACTPNLGQGGGMAIEDALVLAKCLHAENSIETAFALYEKRRTTRTKHIQQRSRLMGQIAQWENSFIVAGREIVTNLLPAKIFEFNLRRTYSYRT